MSADRIVFDPTQYAQLQKQIQGLAAELDRCLAPGGAAALGPDLELQPEPQRWNVSADMVAAGREFGASVAASCDLVVISLDNLQASLGRARSVFDRTADLATYSAAEWEADHPDLHPDPA